MACYLLHFERPINPAHPCQHYLGYCLDLERRIAAHRAGRGARLTQVALERGIDFVVARVWEDGDRSFERQLKRRKESPRLCPLCFPTAMRQAQDVRQLALPGLDIEPWPAGFAFEPPVRTTICGAEILNEGKQRRRGLTFVGGDRWDDGLL